MASMSNGLCKYEVGGGPSRKEDGKLKMEEVAMATKAEFGDSNGKPLEVKARVERRGESEFVSEAAAFMGSFVGLPTASSMTVTWL